MGKWQLEISGGPNIPIGNFDEKTFLAFGGARTGFHLSFSGFRVQAKPIGFGLGLHYFRFGSDLVGVYPPRTMEQEHTASGTLYSIEPTLRIYPFPSHLGGNLPFIALAPMFTWGQFRVSHLYVPSWLQPGQNEINADVERHFALGAMFGIGVDFPVGRNWSVIAASNYRHTPKTKARGPGDTHSLDDFEGRAYFNTTWIDFSLAIRRSI